MEEPFYYRALVLNVDRVGDCELFFLDFGYHEKINFKNLFVLPEQFIEVKFSAFRIKLSNFPEYNDKAMDAKAIEIIKKKFSGCRIGVVE